VGQRGTAFAVFLPPILCAQQAAPAEIRVSSHSYVPPPPHIQVEAKLVELSVAVHDWKGRAIRGLKRGDFRVYDEGKEREIAAFSEEASAGSAEAPLVTAWAPEPGVTAPAKPSESAPLARFVALFIDDVNAKDFAAAGDLGRTQAAARKFVSEALVPGTRIGIFTASGTVTQDFTNEAAKLSAAIAALRPHQRMSEIGMQYCPRITPYRAYEITHLHDRETIRMVVMETQPGFYDCVATRDQVIQEAEETWRKVREISADTLSSIDRVVGFLAKTPGSRVLLMASSGFFGETLEEQQQAIIDHAIRTGVVINALDSKGLYSEAPPGTRPGDPPGGQIAKSTGWVLFETRALPDRLMVVNSAMADIAHGTGGEFFHNNNDLHAGLRQLGVPPEVTYRISFRPEGVTPDGSFHKLKVKVAHSGNFDVVARPGYFAPSDKPADDPRAKFDKAVTTSDTVDDFPAGLAIQIGRPSASQRTLSVVVRIDLSKLDFATQDGRKKQRIAFVSALLDAQGKMVEAKEGWMDLALTQETYDRLVKTGLNAELSFQVAPGMYGLREVVEEAVAGKLSSATHSLDLR
jgi:VWFA-related protein